MPKFNFDWHKFKNRIFVAGFWLGGIMSVVNAQNMIFTNPSDIQNSQAAFVNPALISYQESQVLLGMKVFHLGFLDNNSLAFKNGFFSTSIPYLIQGKISLGLNGQYFNSPMYTQTNFSLALSQKYLSIFSIGLRVNLFSKSYNRSMFDLVDANDPVFANGTTKFAFGLGTGIFMTPLPNLYLSFAADHLNRPNVALASQEYRQPVELNAGIKYGFGKFFVSTYLKKVESEIYPFLEIEPNFSDNWRTHLTCGTDAFRFDGNISVMNGFELGYSYDYPFSTFRAASYGSHQFYLSYFLDRHPGLPVAEKGGDLELPFALPENDLSLQPRFEVFSSVASLEIIEKRIYRKIDPELADEELSFLVQYELGRLDSAVDASAQSLGTQRVDTQYPDVRRKGIFSENYQQTLEEIDKLMANNQSIMTEIITSKPSSNRAAGIKNYLTKQSGVPQTQIEVVMPEAKDETEFLQKVQRGTLKLFETLTVVNHDSTEFHVFPILMDQYDREWRLKITDSRDQLIQEFRGNGKVPPKLRWDWKKGDKKIIEPQLYYYTFYWIDKQGQSRHSEPRLIDVRKIKRNLTVTVSKKPRDIDKNVKKIGIRLNR